MGNNELAALASRQLGLVTRRQALGELSRKTLGSRLATGRLEIVRRGVYRFAGSPAVPGQAQLAACLAAGPAAVASHRAAAQAWEMPGVLADGPELTVPWPQWPRLPGVRCHQTRHLPPSHCTVVGDVPVTRPARTLADLAPAVGTGFLARLVDSSLRRRITTLGELRSVEELLRVLSLRDVLDARQPGYHPGDSDRELDLARLLVQAGLPAPVPQHQVVAGDTVYLLDLSFPEVRLGVEFDGWDSHRTRSAFDHDRRRANALALAGWTLLSFTSASDSAEITATTAAAYDRCARDCAPSGGDIRGGGGGGVRGGRVGANR